MTTPMTDITPEKKNLACPNPEVLSAFAEGHLQPTEAQAVTVHLNRCQNCLEVVSLAMTFGSTEEPSSENQNYRQGYSRRSAKILVASGLVAAAVLFFTLTPRFNSRYDSDVKTAKSLAEVAMIKIAEYGHSPTYFYHQLPMDEEILGPVTRSAPSYQNSLSQPVQLALNDAIEHYQQLVQNRKATSADHRDLIALYLNANYFAEAELAAEHAFEAFQEPSFQAYGYVAQFHKDKSSRYQAVSQLEQLYHQHPNHALITFLYARLLNSEHSTKSYARPIWEHYLGLDSTSLFAQEARRQLQ